MPTATYMTGPRLGGSGTPTFLPSISIVEPACKPYDTYPAPTPMRRSLTTLPWRPSAYYGSARVDPCVPTTASMPEPRSELNRLTDLDSIKVSQTIGRYNRSRPYMITEFDTLQLLWRLSHRLDYNAFQAVASLLSTLLGILAHLTKLQHI